tara:strand:+ start:38 stop:535 length:498 start_codon:yes stop_codon:yes gene_type:complete
MNTYKNFLPKKTFKKMQSYLMSDHFSWYFSNCVSVGDNFFQFTYIFLNERGINCSEEMMNLIKPLLLKIGSNKFYHIKANLLTKTDNIVEHGFHTDYDEGCKQFNGKTAVYYINTCDGYTKFKNGKKIKSEENKLIEFNTKIKHTGSSCTDKKRRVVLNLNYEFI